MRMSENSYIWSVYCQNTIVAFSEIYSNFNQFQFWNTVLNWGHWLDSLLSCNYNTIPLSFLCDSHVRNMLCTGLSKLCIYIYIVKEKSNQKKYRDATNHNLFKIRHECEVTKHKKSAPSMYVLLYQKQNM